MKLYCDPISTTSRPVLMFIAEHGLDIEIETVSLMDGAHLKAEYLALNPNGIVPFLADGDVKLGESAAILKYLARKTGSATYPSDLVGQAKVDEAISWFGTQFHEYFSLFICYPNIGVPHGLDPEVCKALIAYGHETAPRWLAVLDGHMLAGRKFLCGDAVTIADYYGLSQVLLGELADYDFGPYPSLRVWIERMRALPSFDATYAAFFQMVAMVRSQRAAQAA